MSRPSRYSVASSLTVHVKEAIRDWIEVRRGGAGDVREVLCALTVVAADHITDTASVDLQADEIVRFGDHLLSAAVVLHGQKTVKTVN